MNVHSIKLFCFCLLIVTSYSVNASAVSLDPSFGKAGRVAVDIGVYRDQANAVVVQPDGKILAAGSTSNTADLDFMLFRLLADGSLDPSFNIDGMVSTAVGSFDDEIFTLALQKDGKIIAAGYSDNETNHDFALVRYNSDGSLDRSFGLEGMVVTKVGESDDEITDVAVQADGGILLTGSALGDDGRIIVLARYLADGAPDRAFADEGFSLISVEGRDARAESVALTDNRIIVAGSYSNEDKTELMLLGFDTAGRLDSEFGQKGISIPADNSTPSEGYGMFIRDDGKILVVGSVGKAGERDAALFLFKEDGLPDSEFEENGVLITAAGADDDVFYDVLVTEEAVTATGVKIGTDGGRETLLVTYKQDTSLLQNISGEKKLIAEIHTAGNDDGENSAVALAADTSDNSVVVVGGSGAQYITSAEVSKYILSSAADVDSDTSVYRISAGNQYISTGIPSDVTRTTAIFSSEITAGFGSVSQRGIVFSTMPNPSLKDSVSWDSNESTEAPVMSNLSGTVSGTSVTLSLTTDVTANCRYTDSSSGVDYDNMSGKFDTATGGGTSHATSVSDLADGEYTYYVRCENSSSGTVNTTEAVISFTANSDTPVMSNLSPDGTVTSASVTLSLTTNVDATCKYTDSSSGVDYDNMNGTFDTATGGGTSHSASVSNLVNGEYTYYVRCKNSSSGTVNTTNGVISFTVTTSTPPSPLSAALQTVGELFIGTAMAQPDSTDSTSTTTTDTSDNTDEFLEEGSTDEGAGTGLFSTKLENLKPGTYFYARAYAVVSNDSGDTTYYGNQVSFQTADSCFVATAAFGSIFHPSVKILRNFRDQFMQSNPLGLSLVRFYYRHSPPIADIISGSRILRCITRISLLPIVGSAWLTMQLGWLWLLLLPVALFICGQLLMPSQVLRRKSVA